MKIGSVVLDSPLIMAPLAGITDLPFRLIVKKAGTGLVCSEMISTNGLVYQSCRTLRMLDSDPAEKPLSVQIFGSDPAIMADAAQMVAETGADIIDVNFGCAVRKIVKTGSGVALMREPEKAMAVLAALRKAVSVPLTIKIRSGWDRSGDQALNIARIAEDCGVDAITVHPRTASQKFGGLADWGLIRRVKKAVTIPVVGNGDINTPKDAADMFSKTDCDAIMIGRVAIGHPWIFSQVRDYMADREPVQIDDHYRQSAMNEYVHAAMDYYGEKVASRMMRSRLGWYVKGLPHNTRFRETIKRIDSEETALELIQAYFNLIKQQ